MKRKIEIIIVLIIVISTALSIQYIVDAVQYVQYIRSGINAFPTDYQVKLNEIAKEHGERGMLASDLFFWLQKLANPQRYQHGKNADTNSQ